MNAAITLDPATLAELRSFGLLGLAVGAGVVIVLALLKTLRAYWAYKSGGDV